MDSDEEWFETKPYTKRYIVRQRASLRSPLYRHTSDHEEIQVKEGPLTTTEYWSNIRNYLWNRDNKRVCGRDSLAWAQLGCYYCTFLFLLGLLFSALVIVFILLLDKKTPRRSGNHSALALDGGINPGKTKWLRRHVSPFDELSPRCPWGELWIQISSVTDESPTWLVSSETDRRGSSNNHLQLMDFL